jgi:hypothetical protein
VRRASLVVALVLAGVVARADGSDPGSDGPPGRAGALVAQAGGNGAPTARTSAGDTDAVEARLDHLSAANERAEAARTHALEAQLAVEPDPQRLLTGYAQLFASLTTQRRYRKLILVARRLVDHPPPAAPAMPTQLPELAQLFLVEALAQLHDDDGVLVEGERFLTRFPLSLQFGTVRALAGAAIARRREIEEGARLAAAELAADHGAADACRAGSVYRAHHQTRDARAHLERCLATATDPSLALYQLVFVTWEQGDFTSSRQYLDRLRQASPSLHRSCAHLQHMLPVDEL